MSEGPDLVLGVTEAPSLTVTVEEGDNPPVHLTIESEPSVVTVEIPGPAGPPGLPGPEGPEGPPGSGGDKTYVHDQAAPATEWAVEHNLGKHPAVTVIDTSGREVEGGVRHLDENSLLFTSTVLFSGKLICN